MNNAKIWLVVKPTVGIPLFLSAVAVGSFAVHVAVLSNTTWVSDFLSGKEIGSGSASLDAPALVKPASAGADGAPLLLDATTVDGMQIILPDGRKARLVIEDEVAMVMPALE